MHCSQKTRSSLFVVFYFTFLQYYWIPRQQDCSSYWIHIHLLILSCSWKTSARTWLVRFNTRRTRALCRNRSMLTTIRPAARMPSLPPALLGWEVWEWGEGWGGTDQCWPPASPQQGRPHCRRLCWSEREGWEGGEGRGGEGGGRGGVWWGGRGGVGRNRSMLTTSRPAARMPLLPPALLGWERVVGGRGGVGTTKWGE